jgi:hypothetical protein
MTDQEATDTKPTARECVLLYLAHFIRTGGRPGDEVETDMLGQKRLVLTPWYVETKVSVWATNTYRKQHMGSTFQRRWREIKEPPQEALDRLGVSVESRPPEGDNEPSGYNRVWDLTVDLDTFEEALTTHSPWIDYNF